MTEQNKPEMRSDFFAAIKDTSLFKRYSKDSRADVINEMKNYEFQKLLDLDCGTGLLLEQLFEVFPDIEAYGFDYSLERIAEAKKRLAEKNVDFRFGNALQLPYDDCSFDMVISTSTFHHYSEPVDILKEVHRVLKPNASLIICDTHLNATLRYLNKISKPINEVTDFRLYTEKDVWQLMSQAGFTAIQWKKINKFTYIAKGTVPTLAEFKSI